MANGDTGAVGGLSQAEMQAIREEAIALQNTIGGIGSQLNSNLKILGQSVGENTKGFQEGFNASKALATAIAAVDSKTLASRKEQLAFQNKVRKAQEEATRLEAKAGRFRQEAAILGGKQAQNALKAARAYESAAESLQQQAKSAEQIVDQFEELNKKVKAFDDLADFFNEIPGLSKIFGEFQKASDAAREAASKGGNSFAAGAKQLGGAFTKVAAAFAITTLIKGLKNADERTVELSRNLNKSADESALLVRNLNSAARGMQGLTGEELQKGATMLANSLGTTAVSSMSTSKELAAQVKYLGMSADEAEKQAEFSQATGQDIAKAGSAMRGEVMLSNLRNKTGIKYQAIMKDIANTSNATKILMKGQGINITQAAIEAKKLGTTLEGIGRTSASMLDFESSIANELEAELLTGKELNNEKARAAALRGDELTVAKEIQKNGVLEKFSAAKTVLERDAIAKAYGQTSETMGDMVVKSKAMANMKVDDQKSLEKAYSAQMKQVDALRAAGKEKEANNLEAKLSEKLGDAELERQMKNQTFEEKKQEAMSKLAEAMDKMLPIIKAIAKVFEFIGAHAESLSKILAVIAGGALIGKLGKLVSMFGRMGGAMGTATTAAAGLGTAAAGAATAGGAAGGGGLAGAAASAGAAGGGGLAAAGAGAAGASGLAGAAGGAGAAGAAEAGAAASGGGFFSKIGSGLKNLVKGGKGLLSKMNPMTALKVAMKEAGGFKGLLGKAVKGSMLNTLLTGFFAYQDIKDLVQNPVDENGKTLTGKQLNEKVGKITAGGLGGILGGIIGTAAGGPIGSMVGSFGGQWLMEKMMDWFPEASEALGSVVTPLSIWNDDEGKRPKVALKDGGITSGPTHALVGEAGPEAVIPLTAFYAKIDELIVAVKQSGNISIGANKLNEAIGMNLHPMR